MMKNAALVIIAGLALAGCSTDRVAVLASMTLVQGQYEAMQEEPDPEIAKRAIPASLKMLEGLLKKDPDNPELHARLAEGFCGYAFSFLEEEEPDRAAALYARGKQHAEQALAEPAGKANLSALDLEALSIVLESILKEQTPALFWMGQCWGGWLMLSLHNPQAFADISKLEKLIERLLELDASYHYGGPHLLAGMFYGGRSRMLGGNPEKARSHFEANLKLTGGDYLVARYLYARTVAVQSQDRALFDAQLDHVLKASADALPDQRLANEVAKRKSLALKEEADELF